MIEEVKYKIDTKLSEMKSKIRNNDPIIKFLLKDQIKINLMDFGLRVLPFELVENYGGKIIQDEIEYQKYHDTKYNYYLSQWEKHHLEYWKDKIQLFDDYLKPIDGIKTPMEVYGGLNDLMIKIERRACLLNPDPNEVMQKQKRVSGEEKIYKFIRSYWVDDMGNKKRMIARHVGNKFDMVTEEIGHLFHFQGFAVHKEYRSGNGSKYDMVIERGGMKMVVELENIKRYEKKFNNLFMFDELLKKFDEDYPNG